MVVNDAHSLFDLLDQFDPNDRKHFDMLEGLIEKHPNFHLIQAYHLKAIQQLKPELFDKALSHAAIATYDRELLYEFLETQFYEKVTPINHKTQKTNSNLKENKKQTETSRQAKNLKKKYEQIKFPDSLRFSEWATYLKSNEAPKKDSNIDDKFELIDSFLAKNKKIVPNKNSYNKEDLSEKSWVASDELMTETLAKVFVKQKKYNRAIEAYQVLGLKYPEKNSLFADRIKEIKKLQKLKD